MRGLQKNAHQVYELTWGQTSKLETTPAVIDDGDGKKDFDDNKWLRP